MPRLSFTTYLFIIVVEPLNDATKNAINIGLIKCIALLNVTPNK
jgi:hypothetical protein